MTQSTKTLLIFTFVATVFTSGLELSADETGLRIKRRRAPEVVDLGDYARQFKSRGDGLYDQWSNSPVHPQISDSNPGFDINALKDIVEKQDHQNRYSALDSGVSTSIDSDFEFGMVIVLLIIGFVIAIAKTMLSNKPRSNDP